MKLMLLFSLSLASDVFEYIENKLSTEFTVEFFMRKEYNTNSMKFRDIVAKEKKHEISSALNFKNTFKVILEPVVVQETVSQGVTFVSSAHPPLWYMQPPFFSMGTLHFGHN